MTNLEMNILIAKYGKQNPAVRLCEIHKAWGILDNLDNDIINKSADLFAERVMVH